MKKIISKLNIFDFFVLVSAIFILLAVSFTLLIEKKNDQGKNILVTVRVRNNLDIDYPENSNLKAYGNTYLNSVDIPLKVVDVKKDLSNGTLQWVDITVSGQGTISDGRFVFEGERILIGQKAELHSNYFVQGVIEGVKYGNN